MLQEFFGMCGGGGRDEGVEGAVSRAALYLYNDGRAVIKRDGERAAFRCDQLEVIVRNQAGWAFVNSNQSISFA